MRACSSGLSVARGETPYACIAWSKSRSRVPQCVPQAVPSGLLNRPYQARRLQARQPQRLCTQRSSSSCSLHKSAVVTENLLRFLDNSALVVRAVASLVIKTEAHVAVRISTLDAQLLADLVVAEDAIHRLHQFALKCVRQHSRVPGVLVVKPEGQMVRARRSAAQWAPGE